MMTEFLAVSYLISPLLVGLACHGFCIRFGCLRWLARPIDAGRLMRGRRLFGDNKTYRGVVVVSLGTAAGVAFQMLLHRVGLARDLELLDYGRAVVIVLGLALGAAAMLSELPNSWLKRQMGIAPGAPGSGVMGVLFYALDQVDMLVGVWVVLCFAVEITLVRLLWSVVFLFISHQLLTVVGYQLGMRSTAR